MKKTYVKPQTVAMAIDIESAILAGSDMTLKIDGTTQLTSDDMVGAKGYGGFDIWGDDEE